jgi:hypothetical protein
MNELKMEKNDLVMVVTRDYSASMIVMNKINNMTILSPKNEGEFSSYILINVDNKDFNEGLIELLRESNKKIN